MAASIDERVVAMSFENQVFEQRIAQTLASLGKLDTAVKSIHGAEGLENIEKSGNKVALKAPLAALDKLREKLGRSGDGATQGMSEIERAGNKVQLEGANRAIDKTQGKLDQLSAGKTFTDIEKAANGVTLEGISKAIDGISGKFGMMQQAASVAMGNIASQAVSKGAAFGKSFAVGPVSQGFEEYGTNMKSIQTIMANTEGQQVSGLQAVNDHLDELNTYADQTIYNFSEMARNIGTFTAAGVDLPKATASIKGIANLAALSGSNSQQASTAMYQLSQSIAAGKVGLQDWNSVVNAGMGGAVFQKALMRTAENMGTIEKGALKVDKATGKATINGESFRNSIMAAPGKESWLTSDVLTDTLEQLTGDMTLAELKAKGYSDEAAKAIMKQADTAKKAATEVKTLEGVWDVAREGIGSGWAKTFQLIFGDFEEAKKLFTGMSEFLGDWINKVSDARNELLAGWKLGGGRKELIEGLKQMFENVMDLLKPVQQAFRNIFPAKTSEDLIEMTKKFGDFMDRLKPSPQVVGTIYHAFRAFFAILDIGWNIIKGVVGVIGDLFGVVGKGQGSFANIVKSVSHFIVAIRDALVDGKLLEKFFDGLSWVLQKPVELLRAIIGYISSLFKRDENGEALTSRLENMERVLTPIESLVKGVKSAWEDLVRVFGTAKDALEPWFSSFVGKLQNIGTIIGDAISNINFDQALSAINTGLLGGLFLLIRKAFGSGGGLMDELSNTLGGVQELLGGLTGNLENMQKKVQAQLIMAIAAAIVALAGGVYILSTIDGDKLSKAMLAVAIGLGQLMGALKIMSAGLGKFGILALPFIAAGLIGVAIAVTILAGALKIFGSQKWDEIGRGLVGMAGSLGVIIGALNLMPKGPRMLAAGAGLILMGIGLSAIGGALKIIAGMNWEELGRGLFGMVVALGNLALTMSMMPPNMLITAASIVVLGIGLGILAGAVKAMGSMDLETLMKGLFGVLGALTAIAWAMTAFGPAAVVGGVGLFIVANGLTILAGAMKIMGSMSLWEIVKSLFAMGGALGALAVGLYLMIGSLPGAVALMAAAAAFMMLAPAIALMGSLSFGTIFKGLMTMALAMALISTMGLLAAPALAALGIALIPLGLGFMLVAGAAKIFASAMALLSETGQKGIAAFLVAITGFIAILPTIVINFIKGLVEIVSEVAKIAPKVIEALGKILEMVIAFVIENAPKLAVAIGVLVNSIVLVLAENSPKLIQAGVDLLKNLLNGISQNIGEIVTKVADIIVKFQDSLRAKVPALVESGAKLLRAILDGVASKFGEIAASVANLIQKYTTAVGDQAGKIVTAAGTMMGKFIAALAQFGPSLITAGADAILKFLDGLSGKTTMLINRGVEVAGKFIKGIADGLVDLADMGFKALISFLNGIESAIRENTDPLIDAGYGIGDAIFDGVKKAIWDKAGPLRGAIMAVFNALPGAVKKVLGIKSPSRVFHEIGIFSMAGFRGGMLEGSKPIKKEMERIGKQSVDGMTEGLAAKKLDAAKSVGIISQAMVDSAKHILKIRSPSEVFRDIGMNVNRGFRDGLMGSREDVLSAFESMNSSLIDKIRDLRGQVKDGNERLEDLQRQHAEKLAEIAKMRSEKKPDTEAIADAVKESQELEKQVKAESVAVDQNGRALKRAREIRKSLTGSMADEKKELLGLKTTYDEITKKLEAASAELESITKKAEDDQKKWGDQYSTLPDFDKLMADALAEADLTYEEKREKIEKIREEAEKKRKIDQVALYKKALQEQIVATQKYNQTLQALRELGLDDVTYRKLLEKGLEGQDFAEALLRSGKAGVQDINKLSADLAAQGAELARQATKNLYETGIAAAQGLVDGLKAKQAELETAMKNLADVMVNQIKSKLKIKSPSRVFAEIGKFTISGLAQGLAATGPVDAAASDLGRALTDALTREVSDSIDMSPVITPVLDLTQFQRDASQMGDISNVVPITAAASYGQASATSEEVSATQQAAIDAAADQRPSVEFNQYNTSPKALDDVEIYRKTKNQIGQIQSALGVPVSA